MASDLKQMTIFELMAELDRIKFPSEPDLGRDGTWRPQSDEGRQIFEQLIDEENRAALREWYSRCRSLNPAAEHLKRSLESEIGEELG